MKKLANFIQNSVNCIITLQNYTKHSMTSADQKTWKFWFKSLPEFYVHDSVQNPLYI